MMKNFINSNLAKMFSIQQLIKALRKLQNSGASNVCGDLVKQNLKRVVAAVSTTHTTTSTAASVTPIRQTTEGATELAPTIVTSLLILWDTMISPSQQLHPHQFEHEQQLLQAIDSSQQQKQQPYQKEQMQHSQVHEVNFHASRVRSDSLDSSVTENGSVTVIPEYQIPVNSLKTASGQASNCSPSIISTTTTRSQQIHKFYRHHLHHFHTQSNQSLKNKQTQYNAMSSLAAEPKALKQDEQNTATTNRQHPTQDVNNSNGSCCNGSEQKNSSDKPCFNAGFGQILKFMELIGNLKHTKRTGWVLRNVSDPESISGHMYRMSMMTFLLDGSEGLNQIRCMELALVHDLAESVVGDLTPFCGVSRTDKRAMEFKAMEDICKLIEPRGKRIMELFEEYETGESAESKFVKDLDRLDMIMQAFEYEKRDNCLLKHQEFFDSTKGKFNHPFIKKLVDEIYEQRQSLARAEGATPPPPVHVPDMDALPSTNGQNNEHDGAAAEAPTVESPKNKTSTTTS
ncbi:uncharacterized protein LOC128862852 isoform X2 [Anastrepha ludens]|uniref:uncharacterized protein LOC128862852 isoform X2 n=1 Tax=Anastrepha ludens TaxID=28586 RepID=UPI0023B05737|nr:uncharacterized protein LOC128862852 isoform X2 [Anastrepha ludens]